MDAMLTALAQWISRRSLSSASRVFCCAWKRLVMSTWAGDAETNSCTSAARTIPEDREHDDHLAERVAALGASRPAGGRTGAGARARRRAGSSSAKTRPGLASFLRGPLLERALERDHEVVVVGRGAGGDLAVDLAVEHELDQRCRQGLHMEELPVGDRLGDLLGPVLADEVGDPVVGDHHLERGDAAAVGAREQPLADDAAEHAGEDRPYLRVLRGREELDEPADGLRCVERVHRRQHQVAGLGRLKRRLRGLAVAELTDRSRRDPA